MLQTNYESKTEFYCTNCAEKDQRIKELEKETENKSELGLALYTALVKELENQGMIDNIPSAIDQLVGKNCGKYADMYSDYKSQQKELKKVKQEKKKLSIKNGRYKRKIEKLLLTWLNHLCENKSFVSEEKLRETLQGYDKDKLIELYLQMRFERDLWRDLEANL